MKNAKKALSALVNIKEDKSLVTALSLALLTPFVCCGTGSFLIWILGGGK